MGAVSGNRIDVFIDSQKRESRRVKHYHEKVVELDSLSGTSVVSRVALDTSGGFDPYLIAHEEREFAWRVKAAGFKILGLPHSMIEHRGFVRDIREIIRRRNSGYYIGCGQALRRTWHTQNRWRSLLSIKAPLAFLAWLLFLVACIAVAAIASVYWPYIVAIAGTFGMNMVFALKQKGLRRGLSFGFSRFFVLEGLLRGLARPVPTEPYQPRCTRLQQGPVLVSVTQMRRGDDGGATK